MKEPLDTLPALIGMDTEELSALMESRGLPAYRGGQLASWIYRRGAHTFAEMSDLPQGLRESLEASFQVGRSRILTTRHSSDGTVKLLLQMHDGEKVETVGLPYEDRFSCCVSTQVGCPVGCVFCATGAGGFARNLSAGEIVEQVLAVQEWFQRHQAATTGHSRVDHVTFMGMGEPLLNYSSTLKAIHLLNRETGIAMRHLTVSTVGYVPGIRRLAQEKLQLTLAVSLHAPNDSLRRQLVPGMTQWSLAELRDACQEYSRKTGRRPTFEYCLLRGVNDGPAEAEELASLLQGLNCHVNLIPYNEVPGLGFRAPAWQRVRRFRHILQRRGIQVTQREQRGADIQGACGQLRRRPGEAPTEDRWERG